MANQDFEGDGVHDEAERDGEGQDGTLDFPLIGVQSVNEHATGERAKCQVTKPTDTAGAAGRHVF